MIMNHFTRIILLAFIGILGLVRAAPAECPCDLEDSTNYPDTFKWNCASRGLTEMPGQCYDIQAGNVSELILTDNAITSLRAVDLTGLVDLRSLYIDTNNIDFFDPSALFGIFNLEYFHGEHNQYMQFPKVALKNQPYLMEVVLVGSHIKELPDLTDSPTLTRLDARSAELSTMPRPLFAELTEPNFLLTLIGNNIIDVAADILLPLPAGSTINFDNFVTIWAADNAQKNEVLDKAWVINLDLGVSLKVCGADGNPADATMC